MNEYEESGRTKKKKSVRDVSVGTLRPNGRNATDRPEEAQRKRDQTSLKDVKKKRNKKKTKKKRPETCHQAKI